jgi:hypothetical protein
MPKKPVHRTGGKVAGVAVAILRARNRKPIDGLLGGIGCILGADVGAQLPDALEPPTHGGHRKFGHSILAGGGVIKASQIVLDLEAKLIEQADSYSLRCDMACDTIDRLRYLLGEIALRVAAGFVLGLPAGFISHLAMDATTRRRLPIV